MDDSTKQDSGDGAGGDVPSERPAPPPPPSSPSQGTPPAQPTPPQSQPQGSYAPPPPPPKPQPYSAQQPGQGQGQQPGQGGQVYPQNPPQIYIPPQPPQGQQTQQPGYGAPPDYGSHNQPTQVYPVQGPPQRYEPPTEAYPQGAYGPGPVPAYGPPQGQPYPPPQDPNQYPPQHGGPVQQNTQVSVTPKKNGVPVWAWVAPLLLVLVIGGALLGWSALQNQENERKAQATSTAVAQSQATSTAAQAEINRKATSTAVARKTATAATDAANKRGTATAAAHATSTAKAEATSAAQAAKTSTALAIAARTSTAIALAAIAAGETATALANLPPLGTPTTGDTTAISGQVQDVTVEYDVTEAGVKGMRIHLKYTVDHAKGVACQSTVYFYYDTGGPVKDKDGKFTTVDGQVAVSEPFTPGFDSAIYEDFKIFMPYNQLELGPGVYKLRFQVQAYVLNPYKLITTSEYVNFDFTQQ